MTTNFFGVDTATPERLAVKATAVVTDEGKFTAIAAAYSVDRTRERIIRGAFRDTIRRWQEAGRDVPLAWDHGRDARDLIGSIDSASMEERADGLYVAGQLDLEDSELAREAWRSVKKGRISLSFGYLTEAEREGSDGVKELTKLDLMEITLTSVPANSDTRVLNAKSLANRRYEYKGKLLTYDQMVKELGAQQPVRIATYEL